MNHMKLQNNKLKMSEINKLFWNNTYKFICMNVINLASGIELAWQQQLRIIS